VERGVSLVLVYVSLQMKYASSRVVVRWGCAKSHGKVPATTLFHIYK
jgi:hypothetical protein